MVDFVEHTRLSVAVGRYIVASGQVAGKKLARMHAIVISWGVL